MIPALRSLAAQATGQGIAIFARFMTAPRAIWQGIEPVQRQRVYFANHSSNGDFVLIWTVLPPPLRAFIGRALTIGTAIAAFLPTEWTLTLTLWIIVAGTLATISSRSIRLIKALKFR